MDTRPAPEETAGERLAGEVPWSEVLVRRRDVEVAEVVAAERAAGHLGDGEVDATDDPPVRSDSDDTAGAPSRDPEVPLGVNGQPVRDASRRRRS